MPVQIVTGNIFTSTAQTLVNTVNCVGVMGAGIALENRLRHPDMYQKYVEFCEQGLLAIGKLWLYRADSPWILNFPTKDHWKHPSKVQYLELGLAKFVDTYERAGIKSIAFPLLGADKGGLAPELSISVMENYLSELPIDIEIYRYDPRAKDDLFDSIKDWFLSSSLEELHVATGIKSNYLQKIHRALSVTGSDEIFQINQLLSIPGVGLGTVEKVYRASRTEKFDTPSLF